MADVKLEALRDQKKSEFKTQGAGNDRFESDFINACNRAINRINIGADLATAISRVETVEDTATGLDVRYEHVFSDIVTYELVKMGQRLSDKEGRVMTKAELDEEIDSIRQDILHDLQDSDTDDDTYSNVGLGHLD